MGIFRPADILIPKNLDFSKWSVVACDQYTSQPEYWDKVSQIVGDAPSTLNIIFPEVYLNDEPDDRIQSINNKMKEYLDSDIFCELKNSFIFVERTQSNGNIRKGIIGCIDLDEYDFSTQSQSKVRATEGTVVSRIPPRQKIRKNALLEIPHILMLIDDREKKVIEPISNQKSDMKKLYDFDLMMGGGHLTGYLVNNEMHSNIINAVDEFEDYNQFEKKYQVQEKGVLVFAVGDGNHSLATAKTCWEELKKELAPDQRLNHPARYALVEINNIHDETLEFEPIQRVVFDVDPEDLIDGIFKYYEASLENNGGQKIKYIYQNKEGIIYIKNPPCNLCVGTLQKYLDDYISKNGGEVDYIHGNDVLKKLSEKPRTIGFMLDKMKKNELFETVIKDGALPRKTFSMGEAEDKRFYLECKKIK